MVGCVDARMVDRAGAGRSIDSANNCSRSKRMMGRPKNGELNQQPRRRRNTIQSSSVASPVGAKDILTWVVGLWAIQSYRSSPLFGAQRHACRSPLMVQAFSDGWSSRQRQYAPRSLAAKHGVIELKRTTPVLNRPIYPAFHPCRSYAALDVPCRDVPTRCDGRSSLLVCQSTISGETETTDAVARDISDETQTTDVVARDASLEINGVDGVNGMNGISDQINGVNGVNGVNGDLNHVAINGDSSTSQKIESDTSSDIPMPTANGDSSTSQQIESDTSSDIATPTAAGGFTHTISSRAKISAANKGKTPWNKGKSRSDEVRAKIAEGVRRRNRERFLATLEEEGITEEEYHERKKAERRKKDAERRARRTSKGGYTPTEETKKKISKVLKEKYASGEVKRKPRDPSKVRRGFKHTEETKAKIRESLKRKWAEDTEYREHMTNKTVASGNIDNSIRKRISESLKKRWEEPEFRANMMEKFKNRKTGSGSKDDSHRKKISAAMKKKWMDEEYRQRATAGMAKTRDKAAHKVRVARPVMPKMPTKGVASSSGRSLKPLAPIRGATGVGAKKSKAKTKGKKQKKSATKRKSAVQAVRPITTSATTKKSSRKKPSKEESPAKDGSISRMREERRDLYDLLYGDEDDDGGGGSSVNGNGGGTKNGRAVNGESDNILSSGMMSGVSSNTMAVLMGDDDDLDDFDPYGLQ